MSELLNTLNNFNFKPYDKLWLAYSGGVDSCALLHALAQKPEIKCKLTAIHINHNLHQNSHKWQQHCGTICQSLNVPLVVREIDPALLNKKTNIEELARNARYDEFEKIITHNDGLILGHHRQDQAETFLLRLFRGAGIDGLSAMKKKTKRHKFMLLRPILELNKKSLIDYAIENKLTWVEDPSNLDPSFNRNFIRNEVMPLIKTRYPSVEKNIVRSAALCLESQTHIENSCAQRFHECLNEDSSLNLKKLLTFSKTEQKIFIRKWLSTINCKMPRQKQLQVFVDSLNHCQRDKHPLLCIGNLRIQEYRQALYHYKSLNKNVIKQTVNWLKPFPPIKIDIMDTYLHLKPNTNKSNIYISPSSKIEVKYRQGGEKIKLNGVHQKVKKILNDLAIPCWQRAHLPLVYIDKQLAAIGENIVADPNNLKDKNNHYLFISKL